MKVILLAALVAWIPVESTTRDACEVDGLTEGEAGLCYDAAHEPLPSCAACTTDEDCERLCADFPPTYLACVAQCEREEPGDRGQGCIDTDCNPLLDSDSDDE